ncbi:MAG TPA: hypothetical protein VM617_05220 [Thermoanaerobaculia bacterium]|nr:hypothetical protein [Thermoanaerobaculia bacterium]
MEQTVGAVLPPGLRLRRLQPLFDRDLTCPLIYDLERGLLLEVPGELRHHAAQALDAGDPEGDLVAWLAGEDLLTWEDHPQPPAADRWQRPAIGDGLGTVWFAEDELHCHPAAADATATLAAVEALLAGTGRGARCVLHLVAAGELRRPRTLRRVVAGAGHLGRRSGRQVALELTTDGRGLSPSVARFLADHRVAVRLTGGSSRLVETLLGHLAGRFTLCALLDTGDRLLDLWQRAMGLGLHHLDATKVLDRRAPGAVLAAELRQYRRDLFVVADDTFTALAAGRAPQPLFGPLARVVRRHLSGRPVAVGVGGSTGYFGLLAEGGVFPLLAPLADGPGDRAGGAGEDESRRDEALGATSCSSCWGRRLCSRGRDAVARPGSCQPAPRPDRCELWRAEIEVGLLLYRRLEGSDPAAFLGLAGEAADAPFFDPYALRAAAGLTIC